MKVSRSVKRDKKSAIQLDGIIRLAITTLVQQLNVCPLPSNHPPLPKHTAQPTTYVMPRKRKVTSGLGQYFFVDDGREALPMLGIESGDAYQVHTFRAVMGRDGVRPTVHSCLHFGDAIRNHGEPCVM